MPEDVTAGSDWQDIISKHQSAMVEDLSVRFAANVNEAVTSALTAERSHSSRAIARACDEARRAHSEFLNQALRRLRMATSEEKTLQLLHDTCAPYAERCIVLVFAGAQAHAVAGGEVVFEVSDAPAVLSAIESRDPLVTVVSAGQLSGALATALDHNEEDDEPGKAYLFPLISRQAAVAIVIAAGKTDPSPVELLCEAAAMRLESFAGQSPAAPVRAAAHGTAWEDLSAEDQRLHLQAQRVARVRVAEMRLGEEDAFERGLASSNLYGALEARIDAARKEFLQSFLSKSTTMVDYLHLEILRSLAKDDIRLLGPGYPGPMV
jgi:hypothetical protein